MSLVEKIFGSFSDRELKKINPIAKKVLDLEPTYAAMSDSELQAQTPALKDRLAKGETLDDILPEAFATCREAAWRVLGMKHFPVQVVGGIAPPPGQHRRDADRRGQDPGGHPARLPQRPVGRGGSMWSPSTTTLPSATASGWASSTAGWG